AAGGPRGGWPSRRARPGGASGSASTPGPKAGRWSITCTAASPRDGGRAPMPSHLIDFQLFGDQFATPEMRAVFDERAMLQRWLDVEAALAAAQAELGLIPARAAEGIARAARVDLLDLETVKRDLKTTAH